MVENIDFTVFVFVCSFLFLLVHILDRSFVDHLLVCSSVSGRVCLVVFGLVFGRSFVRLVVWSFGSLFVWL